MYNPGDIITREELDRLRGISQGVFPFYGLPEITLPTWRVRNPDQGGYTEGIPVTSLDKWNPNSNQILSPFNGDINASLMERIRDDQLLTSIMNEVIPNFSQHHAVGNMPNVEEALRNLYYDDVTATDNFFVLPGSLGIDGTQYDFKPRSDGTFEIWGNPAYMPDVRKAYEDLQREADDWEEDEFGIGDILKIGGLALGGYGLANMFTGGGGMGLFDSIGNFLSDPISSLSNLFSGGGSGTIESAAEAIINGGYSPFETEELLSNLYWGSAENAAAFDLASGGMDTSAIAEMFGNYTPQQISSMVASGAPEINSLLSQIPTSLRNTASQIIKSVTGGGGTMADAVGLVGKLLANNKLANSNSDIIGDWLDEIKNASPIDAGQRKQLGDMALARFGKDYLDPHIEGLMSEYGGRRDDANALSDQLTQLYSDPSQMALFKSIDDLATKDLLRTQGAKGMLQAGSLGGDLYNSKIKSMLQVAQPMTQSLGTMFQGQQMPTQMINALAGGNQAQAQAGGAMINAGSGTQQALGNYISQVAAPAELVSNPVRTGIDTLYGQNTKPKFNSMWG
jgi:hypothetical protein